MCISHVCPYHQVSHFYHSSLSIRNRLGRLISSSKEWTLVINDRASVFSNSEEARSFLGELVEKTDRSVALSNMETAIDPLQEFLLWLVPS